MGVKETEGQGLDMREQVLPQGGQGPAPCEIHQPHTVARKQRAQSRQRCHPQQDNPNAAVLALLQHANGPAHQIRGAKGGEGGDNHHQKRQHDLLFVWLEVAHQPHELTFIKRTLQDFIVQLTQGAGH